MKSYEEAMAVALSHQKRFPNCGTIRIVKKDDYFTTAYGMEEFRRAIELGFVEVTKPETK